MNSCGTSRPRSAARSSACALSRSDASGVRARATRSGGTPRAGGAPAASRRAAARCGSPASGAGRAPPPARDRRGRAGRRPPTRATARRPPRRGCTAARRPRSRAEPADELGVVRVDAAGPDLVLGGHERLRASAASRAAPAAPPPERRRARPRRRSPPARAGSAHARDRGAPPATCTIAPALEIDHRPVHERRAHSRASTPATSPPSSACDISAVASASKSPRCSAASASIRRARSRSSSRAFSSEIAACAARSSSATRRSAVNAPGTSSFSRSEQRDRVRPEPDRQAERRARAGRGEVRIARERAGVRRGVEQHRLAGPLRVREERPPGRARRPGRRRRRPACSAAISSSPPLHEGRDRGARRPPRARTAAACATGLLVHHAGDRLRGLDHRQPVELLGAQRGRRRPGLLRPGLELGVGVAELLRLALGAPPQVAGVRASPTYASAIIPWPRAVEPRRGLVARSPRSGRSRAARGADPPARRAGSPGPARRGCARARRRRARRGASCRGSASPHAASWA